MERPKMSIKLEVFKSQAGSWHVSLLLMFHWLESIICHMQLREVVEKPSGSVPGRTGVSLKTAMPVSRSV